MTSVIVWLEEVVYGCDGSVRRFFQDVYLKPDHGRVILPKLTNLATRGPTRGGTNRERNA